MMQQWQQMSSQQKAIAIGLIAVIVAALAFIIWWLVSSTRPPTPETVSTPAPGGPGGPVLPPQGGAPTGPPTPMGPTPPSGPPMGAPPSPAPEMAGMPSPMPAQPTPQPAPAPAGPQPGKLTRPPEPGRGDPFAALPPGQPSRPVLPVIVPAVQPATVGTTYAKEPSLRHEEPINRLQALNLQQLPEINFTSYLQPTAPARPATTTDASGWRMVGFMMAGQRVSAIVALPTGRTRTVQPGSTVDVNGVTYTVTKVEADRVTLRSEAGEEIVVPRRATPPAPPSGPAGPYGPGPYGPGTPYGGYGGYGRE